MGLINFIKHAWNIFNDKNINDSYYNKNNYITVSSFTNPYRPQLTTSNDRSILAAVYNRIAIDCSQIDIRHVKVDDEDKFIETIESDLNDRLTIEANKDQTSKSFIQDVVMSLLDEGYVAIVPIETSLNLKNPSSYDIKSMRTGKIIQWYPDAVQVDLYNDRIGQHQTVTVPKKDVAIIENPYYEIMNSANSTLKRIIRKLNLIDYVDEESGSGKLNLILQLPYMVKTDVRKQQAQKRLEDLNEQLKNNRYGIAYTDGTEKITQLNRSIDNNMNETVVQLMKMYFTQLGISENVLNGTAQEAELQLYRNRTLKPILEAICDEISRKFITKTGRTQGQRIKYYYDAFELMPIANLAEVADKFSRNAIMSANEIRQFIGLKPSAQPEADELSNKNLYNEPKEEIVEEENIPILQQKISHNTGGENNNEE